MIIEVTTHAMAYLHLFPDYDLHNSDGGEAHMHMDHACCSSQRFNGDVPEELAAWFDRLRTESHANLSFTFFRPQWP